MNEEVLPEPTPDQMDDMADGINAFADRVVSVTTQSKMRQAASSLRWQARWNRRHDPLAAARRDLDDEGLRRSGIAQLGSDPWAD